MSIFKYLFVFTFVCYGFINAAEFEYQYVVRNGVLLGGVFKYHHINMRYANKHHTYLALHLGFTAKEKDEYLAMIEVSPDNNVLTAMVPLKIDYEFIKLLIRWACEQAKCEEAKFDEEIKSDHEVKKISTKEVIKSIPLTKEKELKTNDWVIYVEVKELLQELGVEIEPQAWYRRYFKYLVGALAVGLGGYLYLNHAQKSLSK